ncbi:MAG TPA: class I SAM-dependent methyltransferase [Arenibaculum sp.]|nr:class I SAM-dependent methyltransferase [Arenibaculum sp.]
MATARFLSEAVHRYVVESGLREHEPLRRLRAETSGLAHGEYRIAPEIGMLLAFLAELTGARLALDVGTFTGYSALAVALAMGPEGRVVTCDRDEAWTAVARRHWAEAGVADRIELHLDAAEKTLDSLIGAGMAGSFDMALVDADKRSYPRYYEQALILLRPGGLMAVDNTLWRGTVADEADMNPKALLFRRFNRFVRQDPRVGAVLLPLGDGLTLVRKRP